MQVSACAGRCPSSSRRGGGHLSVSGTGFVTRGPVLPPGGGQWSVSGTGFGSRAPDQAGPYQPPRGRRSLVSRSPWLVGEMLGASGSRAQRAGWRSVDRHHCFPPLISLRGRWRQPSRRRKGRGRLGSGSRIASAEPGERSRLCRGRRFPRQWQERPGSRMFDKSSGGAGRSSTGCRSTSGNDPVRRNRGRRDLGVAEGRETTTRGGCVPACLFRRGRCGQNATRCSRRCSHRTAPWCHYHLGVPPESRPSRPRTRRRPTLCPHPGCRRSSSPHSAAKRGRRTGESEPPAEK